MKKNMEGSLVRANTLLGLQFLSDFGDQITSALLALSLLEISQSTSEVGFVYFSTTVGYVVFTLMGGYLGDKINKRNLLVYSDLGRGALVLLLILALYNKSIGLIYFVSFFLAMLGSLHRPVKLTIWTQSIPHKNLESYNSLSELSVQLSTICGPLIAAAFIAGNIGNVGFAIDAATFILCALGFSWLLSRKSTTEELIKSDKKRSILAGFNIIRQESQMRSLVAYDAIQMIGFGAFNATFLVLAQRDFGWSKAQYSWHLSIIAGFTIAGALLGSTRFVGSLNKTAKLVAGALISGIALVVLIKVRTFPVGSILFGICDGLAVLTMAVTRTRVQLIAKEKYQESISSIIAARSIIIKAATLIGAGGCLLVDDYVPLSTTLLLFTIPISLSFLSILPKAKATTSARVPNHLELLK